MIFNCLDKKNPGLTIRLLAQQEVEERELVEVERQGRIPVTCHRRVRLLVRAFINTD